MLLYFGLGLIMLGQVRFSLLHSAWQDQDIPVDRTLPGRWKWASVTLIVIAAALAFALPNSYPAAAKLLEWFGIALAWVLAIIFYLGGLLIFVITWLFHLILSRLFRPSAAGPEPAVPPRFDPPVIPPLEPGVTPEWVLLLRSVLFSALIAAGALYVIRTYLRDHPEMGAWLRDLRPVGALRRLWETIRGWFARLKRGVQIRLPRPRLRRPVGKKSRQVRFPFFRLGALSPRERILYYYWSILRRAERLGYPRRRPETPNEYQDNLKPHLPRGDAEMEELTKAFIEVRYSKHPIRSGRDRELRSDWQRVKESLRALRRSDKGNGEPE